VHVNDSAHPLVAVVWDDAKATAVVEYDLNEVRTQFHKPARYTTYGLLLVDDQQGVTLASEEGDDQNLRGLSFIPRQMIVEVVFLARRRVRKPSTKRRKAAPAAAPAAETPTPATPSAPGAQAASAPTAGPDRPTEDDV
jgi:hypothetical protein